MLNIFYRLFLQRSHACYHCFALHGVTLLQQDQQHHQTFRLINVFHLLCSMICAKIASSFPQVQSGLWEYETKWTDEALIRLKDDTVGLQC